MRLRRTVADTAPAPTVSTTRAAGDLDYITAGLHGRRSRMAEKERLDSLCRSGSLQDFFRALFPHSDFEDARAFQRRCLSDLIGEISDIASFIARPGGDLIKWTLIRFQAENLKILVRAHITGTAMTEWERYLLPLPGELALDVRALAAAESLRGFARLLPTGPLRENLERTLKRFPEIRRPFLPETALDRGYLDGLLRRAETLAVEDREIVKPMVFQEVDLFHLMLVARGRFHYRLAPALLQSFHLPGTRIPAGLFVTMLHDPDLSVAADRAIGRVLDAAPFEEGLKNGLAATDAPVPEGLAWKRFFRLANTAFRRSHMGLGAVAAYMGLRRVEAANLITISEGIRIGLAPEVIRGRLIPRAYGEEGYV